MFRMILTATAVLAASSAMASSIEVVSGNRTANNSIEHISCTSCPPLAVKNPELLYKVPVLEKGFQKVEIRKEGDKEQIVRTENFSGGSPVVRVSTASIWMPDNNGMMVAVRPSADVTADGIDHSTTAAVRQTEPVRADMSGQPDEKPSFENFDLRPSSN